MIWLEVRHAGSAHLAESASVDSCRSELHTNMNAARNVIEVQQPSAVAGRQKHGVQDSPNYGQRQVIS